MRKATFPFLKTFVLVLGVLLLAANVAFAQVPVTVQNVVGKAASVKDVGITVGDLTGLNVLAYQFTMTYDTTVVKITGYTTTGTLSANMEQVLVNFGTPGVVQVGASGTVALTGSGTLLKLTASFVAPGLSPLAVSGFMFNEGVPAATVTSGMAMVPTLSVLLPAAGRDTVRLGRTFDIPLTTEDLTGKGVLAYQFIVTFNPAVLKIVGVSTTGTLSSAITNFGLDTTTAGTVKVAAAGTEVLTGAGTLVNLVARAIDGGTSDLTFTDFLYNEGTPAVGAIDGIETIVPDTRGIHTIGGVPTQFGLNQNYPNPFNPSTMISFNIAKESDVTLEVYNILGMRVRTLIAGQRMNAASYSVDWDGKDNAGMTLPSGVYLYRIHAGQFDAAMKMVLMK